MSASKIELKTHVETPLETKIERSTMKALVFLSLAFFMQASTALTVVGGLASIAKEWSLSTAASAMLVTAFGATFALTAPLLQMLIGHWERRKQILIGLSVMAVGAVIFAFGNRYEVLFGARVIMGLGAALISPVLSALGSSLVKPHLQGAALAIVIMGYSIATVISVPASAWIATEFGPRSLFVFVAFLTVLTAFAIGCFIRDRSVGERSNPKILWGLLKDPTMMKALMVVFFASGGIFSTYTMITPILHDVYGADADVTSLTLLLFGVAGVVGNLFVRGASTRYASVTLLRSSFLSLIVVFASLLLLPKFMAFFVVAVVVWPFVADMIWPSQQRRIVELKPQLRGIGLALNSSFMFSGIAVGSGMGGYAYSHFGYQGVLSLSIGMLSVGLMLLQTRFGANKISVGAR